MSKGIVEGILGSNSIYTNNYIEDTLLLTRSIIIVIHSEAKLYNNYLINEKGLEVDLRDKSSWRYYKHLAGEYHEVDELMRVVSWDSGREIVIDKETLTRHKTTRLELLKYGSLYSRVVTRYPEQELLLRSIISTSGYIDINDIIEMENYTIVSHNKDLVEEGESNLIVELENRLKRYAVYRMINYYNVADSLHLASVYHVTYNFILTSIFSIRLTNVKTPRAHSYHILSYFASHHRLDEYYRYLTKEQILYLYRNLLYLDSYAGTNEVFRELIDNILTKRNVSLLNYIFNQKNDIGENGETEYRFNQVLLNNSDLVIETRDFDLDEIKGKEEQVLEGNEKEYRYHREEIESTLENALDSQLLTKDLDVSLVDNSNDVKHLLLDVLVDNWAMYLDMGLMSYDVKLIDPISGYELVLSSTEAFKLFTILVHVYLEQDIVTIPDYNIIRIIKPILPSKDSIVKKFYRNNVLLEREVEKIIESTPIYGFVDTPHDFREEVIDKYIYGLGLWLYTANTGHLDYNAQIKMTIENLHENLIYEQGNESVEEFLRILRYSEVLEYSKDVLLDIILLLLDSVSASTLDFLENTRFVHRAMVEIFSKFKSYSTQFVSTDSSSDTTLAMLGFPHVGTGEVKIKENLPMELHVPYVDFDVSRESIHRLEYTKETKTSYSYASDIEVDLGDGATVTSGLVSNIKVELSNTTLVNEEELEWIGTEASQEHLLFLFDKL